MYSVDGIPLQNPGYGWRLKRTSEPRVARNYARADFNAASRDGTTSVRGSISTPTLTLVVQAPGTSIDVLRRLLRLGAAVSLTSDPSTAIAVEAMTVTPRTVTAAGDGIVEVTVVYRCPAVWWRDVATSDWTAVLNPGGAGATQMGVLNDSTGSVQDGLLLVQGGVTNLRAAGSNNSWVEYTGALAGQWLRIDTVQGRCWLGQSGNGTDPWSNTAQEVTGGLNTGAYPYYLELVPASTGNPGATLTVSWDAVSSQSTVTLRARNAYDR